MRHWIFTAMKATREEFKTLMLVSEATELFSSLPESEKDGI
jgi:hypothetical protein